MKNGLYNETNPSTKGFTMSNTETVIETETPEETRTVKINPKFVRLAAFAAVGVTAVIVIKKVLDRSQASETSE